MSTPRRILLEMVVMQLTVGVGAAMAQERPLLIITNRTLIDNQFIFGRNAASPPTLSKRNSVVFRPNGPTVNSQGCKPLVLICGC